ncbi:serine hydroxymethyltransferase 4, partial [Fagus crenata]
KTQEIDAGKRKDLVIALEVEQWVQMVDNISQGLQRFIDEDKMFLDPKSRYSLSRKAKKKTLAIEKLLRDAPSLNKMSCPPPPQGIGSSSIEGFKDFESRISMIKEVIHCGTLKMIHIPSVTARSKKNSLTAIGQQRSENLELTKIINLKNLKDVIDATSDQNLRAAFPSLERLKLYELDNLEKIYDGQFPKRSFSGAQYACFGNLRYLTFPKLTKINCHGLRRLIGFCKPMDPVELVQPSHAKSMQPSSNLEFCFGFDASFIKT